MTSEEWGPWIEHDGNGCPCVGMWCQVVFDDAGNAIVSNGRVSGNIFEGTVSGKHGWHGPDEIGFEVIRYRIRKPRGLTVLEDLLENLPEREGVDA